MPLMAIAIPEILNFPCEPSHPSAHLTHDRIIASPDRLDLHQIYFHLYCFCTQLRTMGGQTTFGLADAISGPLHLTCFSSLPRLSGL
jgi:hypothetical protein